MLNRPVDLEGDDYAVRLTERCTIEIRERGGRVVWSSSKDRPPAVTFTNLRTAPLASAGTVEVFDFERDDHQARRIAFNGFEGSEASLELTLSLYSDDTLEVRLEEPGVGGGIRDVDHLFRFEKPVVDGGYMVLPHGSGYLIPADCPDELPGDRADIADFSHYSPYIGAGWSMPFFGFVRGSDAVCVIVEDWWDCWVESLHRPGEFSGLDFSWKASLGTFSYPRRMFVHPARGMDHAGMAKHYRNHALEQGLVRTLDDKSKETPIINQYIENVLVRWPAWNPRELEQVRGDLRRFLDMGFGVNLFFPKIPGSGWDEDKTATSTHALWQGFLLENPVPGGWSAVSGFSKEMSDLGILIQGFVPPLFQHDNAPDYDLENYPILEDGTRRLVRGDWTRMGMGGDVERNHRVLDSIRRHDIHIDVLYYDGYAAFSGPVEDFTPGRTCTRRQGFEAMNDCFRESRADGIMPGGELGRFWCMADCDYFFYTDWAPDRLVNTEVGGAPGPIGEPVPLFPLVFNECYMAGFAGGGHTVYGPGVDWWREATPRLYELLFGSAPSYSWLPEGRVPVRDWDSDEARARIAWLRRRHTHFKTIAKSEMTKHQFLSADRRRQRVSYANGVTAEFDMAENLCRLSDVDGFSGDWEAPCEDLGWYPSLRSEFPKK